MHDQIAEAVLKAAELGGAQPRTWHVPESADIRFSDTHQAQHFLADATITHWSHDG